MKNWNYLNRLPVYILIAGAVGACGSSTGAFSTSLKASSALSSTTGSTTSTGTGSTGSTSGTGGSTSGTGSAPAYSFGQFNITGPGGTNPVYSTKSNGGYIQTDNVLKVRVTVADGGLLQAPTGYSGFSTNYSCASYKVTIFDDSGTQIGSKNTQWLQIPGQPPCEHSTGLDHDDLDFSASVSNPHGGIEVRVETLQYDFYCKLWYQSGGAWGPYGPYYSYWCPGKVVYKNHSVDGSLQVQVNGTTFQ